MMNKLERIKRIREILTASGQADVAALSNLFGVSSATIRTDLEELEQEGFLTRYHGGAAINRPEVELKPVSFLDALEYSPDLEEVGATAAQLIAKEEYGNLVAIRHDNGYVTYYAHNSSILVSVGQKVYQGQIIAKAGMTGNASGPHCHFEVRINNTSVNPRNYLR